MLNLRRRICKRKLQCLSLASGSNYRRSNHTCGPTGIRARSVDLLEQKITHVFLVWSQAMVCDGSLNELEMCVWCVQTRIMYVTVLPARLQN
jgi:hypothetical protein